MDTQSLQQREAFVRGALAGTRFANVRWVAETGSTNDDLAEAATAGAPEQVLITDLQTTGRGRRDRTWEAPTGSGLLMSLLVRNIDPQRAFWAVGAVSLAACESIDVIVESTCSVKWPNDVLLGGGEHAPKKVAGVLAQVVEDAVIVGIGINANWPQLPPELAKGGTSVMRHVADRQPIDRSALAADILGRVIGHVEAEPEVLRSRWRAKCSTIGQRVRLQHETGATVGIATDVGLDGSLQLRNETGESWHHVGDVVHLRPHA